MYNRDNRVLWIARLSVVLVVTIIVVKADPKALSYLDSIIPAPQGFELGVSYTRVYK